MTHPGTRTLRAALIAALGALTLGTALAGGGGLPLPPGTQASALLRDPQGLVRGTVSFREVPGGLEVTVSARGLTPGMHGMHVHTNPVCAPGPDATTGEVVAFGAAGGHFDPYNTGNHATPTTPNTEAHAGDLPMVTASAGGAVQAKFVTRKLTLRGLTGALNRSVVLHAMHDDYASDPAGKSGSREQCGVITPAG